MKMKKCQCFYRPYPLMLKARVGSAMRWGGYNY